MTNHPKISSKDFEKELKGGKYEGEYDTCQKKKKNLVSLCKLMFALMQVMHCKENK